MQQSATKRSEIRRVITVAKLIHVPKFYLPILYNHLTATPFLLYCLRARIT